MTAIVVMTVMTVLGIALVTVSYAAEDGPVLESSVNGAGTVTLSKEDPLPGDQVQVTAEGADGYYLAQIRIGSVVSAPADPQGDEEQGQEQEQPEMTYQTLRLNGNTAVFEMPDTDTIVYADFISIVWDGTIDLTWYDPDADTITIDYPAQLEGAAALTAGLFNDIPTREVTVSGATASIPDISDEEGNVIELSEKDKVGHVTANNKSGYQVFEDNDGDERQTAVVGDLSLLGIHHSEGDAGSNNQVTTNYYWFGEEDFTGKIIELSSDLDMGGSLRNGTLQTVMDNWSGPNYMPLGGQYSMDSNNGYTRLSAGFNGIFDGKGHMVYNIFAARHAPSVTFGNCQAVGLIGLLGLYHTEDGTPSAIGVRNVAIDGFINGNRSLGGIVGKTSHAKSIVIENCINFATVYNTDAKGCGGIVGAAWYDVSYGDTQPQIRNCVNFGLVCTGYNKNAGGLVGSCESIVSDSYTIGYAAGEGKNNHNAGQALGTNNGGAVWYNCYTVEGAGSGKGTTPGTATQQVHGSTYGSAIRVLNSPKDCRQAVGLLNGKVKSNGPDENGYMDDDDDVIKNAKRNWIAGEETGSRKFISPHMQAALQTIVSWHNPQVSRPGDGADSSEFTLAAIAARLTALNGEGLPVPLAFMEDHASIAEIKTTGTPTKKYLTGETFDTGNHEKQSIGPDDQEEDSEFSVWAVFDDDTYQEIEDYTVVYEGGASEFVNSTEEDTVTTSVTVSGSYQGQEYSFPIEGIEVTKCELLSMKATAYPNNLFYAMGESFDPTGLVISEDYGAAGEDGGEDDVRMTIKAKFLESGMEITKTITATNQEFTLSGEALSAYVYMFDDDRFSLPKNKDKMNVKHSFNGDEHHIEIPISVSGSEAPRLIKDGENDRQIVYIESEDDFRWFANQIATGIDPDMYAELEEDLDFTDAGIMPVGMRKDPIKTNRELMKTYAGVFNGNGHTIELDMQRDKDNAGLFYEIDANGKVCDLTVSGRISGIQRVGSIAAYLGGGTVSGCMNRAAVKGTKSAVGGLVGEVRSSGSSISECTNTASVCGALETGGIVGLCGSECMIEKSVNTGRISVSGDAGSASIGGLAGRSENGTTLKNSRNTGFIECSADCAAGGIMGTVGGQKTTITIENCYNRGHILDVYGSGNPIGGIAGEIVDYSKKKPAIKKCYNAGSIDSLGDAGTIGAIVGKSDGYTNIKYNYALEGIGATTLINVTSGTPAEENAMFLSADELVTTGANKLGDVYQPVEGEYPILAWETYEAVRSDLDAANSEYETAITGVISTKIEEAEALREAADSSRSALEESGETTGEDYIAAVKRACGDAAAFLKAARLASDLTELLKNHADVPAETVEKTSGLLDAAGEAAGAAHRWKQCIDKASPAADGRTYESCIGCGAERNVTVVPKVSSFTLSKTSYTYAGKAWKPNVTVKDSKGAVIAASNYTIAYSNNIKAGKATVKVTLRGNRYQGTKDLTFTIAKASNPLTVKAKTVTAKFKTLKKKNVTFARAKVLTISKNQGAVTYVKSSGNSKITINKKTGKVTVKKKLKKGTYSVKVKVTAAGNANYKALTKTVTFKVRVK